MRPEQPPPGTARGLAAQGREAGIAILHISGRPVARAQERRAALAIALVPVAIEQDETAGRPGDDALGGDFQAFDGIGQFMARRLDRGFERFHALIYWRLHARILSRAVTYRVI